jgi:hypothetical protein
VYKSTTIYLDPFLAQGYVFSAQPKDTGLLEEKWAEIEGWPDYLISNYGSVWSKRHERLLTLRPNDEGYLRVALYNDGARTDFYVERLVAMAFFNGFRPGMQVMHVNGDKTNNSTGNLHIRQGREPRRVRHSRQEPWGQRVRIKETGEIFRTVRDCANYIGGDYSSIYACLRGQRRTHLGFSFEHYAG